MIRELSKRFFPKPINLPIERTSLKHLLTSEKLTTLALLSPSPTGAQGEITLLKKEDQRTMF